MPSSPGGKSGKPLDRKNQSFKLSVASRQPEDEEWSTFSSKWGKSKNVSSPISPTLKQIMDNTPRLHLPDGNPQLQSQNYSRDNITNEANMSEVITPDIITDVDQNFMVPDNFISYDNINNSSNDTPLRFSLNDNKVNDPNILSFTNLYLGPIYITIDSIDKKLHSGKLHPLQIGKLLHKLVKGITEIKPIGSRVRLSFDNIFNMFRNLTFLRV